MKAHTMYLFTNGHLIARDKSGKQIPEIAIASFKETRDLNVIRKACSQAVIFGISKYREWMIDLTKDEFMALMQVD